MGNVLVNEASLQAIADAIREKNGTEDTYKPSQMADAVRGIIGGEEIVNGLKYVEGTVALASGVGAIVTHNAGFVPEIFILYPKFEVAVGEANEEVGFIGYYGSNFGDLQVRKHFCFVLENRTTYTDACVWFEASNRISTPTESNITIPYRSSSYPFKTEVEYGWIAIAGKSDSEWVDLMQYATRWSFLFHSANFDSVADVEVTYGTDFNGAMDNFVRSSNVRTLKIKGGKDIQLNISTMAYDCKNLIEIDFSECSTKIANITQAFGYCSVLKEIKGELDVSKVDSIGLFAQNNNVLEEVRFKKETIFKTLAIGSPMLSDESIQSIIDGLADLTDSDTQTLTFHADVKAKLTEEQIATITSKNWTLA